MKSKWHGIIKCFKNGVKLMRVMSIMKNKNRPFYLLLYHKKTQYWYFKEKEVTSKYINNMEENLVIQILAWVTL